MGTTWSAVTENRQAVIAALKRGECDGLLPVAVGFLDEFATFLGQHDILRQFQRFPDPRERRTILVPLFCNVLLHRQLFRLPHLTDIERVLFQSPDVLRKLGFNLRQIHEGCYRGGQQRPFHSEALADFFNAIDAAALQEHQGRLSQLLVQQFPWLSAEGTAVLDANTTVVPNGHSQRPGAQLKACVRGLRAGGHLFPRLWEFTERGPGEDNDLAQGKRLIAAAQQAWGEGAVHHLIVDRGFIDGAWISGLKAGGIDTVIGLRGNMDLYQDMLGLSQLEDAPWLPASPPKLHDGAAPSAPCVPSPT